MRSSSRFCFIVLVAMCLLAVFSGCSRRDPARAAAAPSKFAEQMNLLVGGSLEDTIVRLGRPTDEIDLGDGRMLYEWTDINFGTSFWGRFRATKCKVRVVIDENGVVGSWNSNGYCG